MADVNSWLRRLYLRALTIRVMRNKSRFVARRVREYSIQSSSAPDSVLVELARETEALGPAAGMLVPHAQGTLLTTLVASARPTRAIEVGTFTGYSSLCIARGLSDGGQLLCLDISERWTSIAEKYWARAGVGHRIELRLGPAAETISALPAEPTFDFAFIDADKVSYQEYLDLLLPRMRLDGLLVVDNVLLHGKAARGRARGAEPAAMRRFNARLAADHRLQTVMLPFADGLTLARVRAH
ncbi:O-methyltransferase [Candidatus Frankia nodulisporulans]|uniref:O-methyltransferase n=1 Tax=Candidatus Frankia nodulisporulans TaxID=2060052 RepID=UPI001CDD271D|nr:O-methyltransferase [Candidatus Frankia nodulisporulans]